MNLERLRSLYKSGAYIVTQHCMKRITERGIALSELRRAIMEGEVIEDYPDDFPYPSALILGRGLHVVAGEGDEKLWLITACRPDLTQWENNLKAGKVIK